MCLQSIKNMNTDKSELATSSKVMCLQSIKNMNTDYKVGDFIYNADIYDGLNNSLSDLEFYKKWLP